LWSLDPLEHVLAAVDELELQITGLRAQGRRDEDLVGSGEPAHARRVVHGTAIDAITVEEDVAVVEREVQVLRWDDVSLRDLGERIKVNGGSAALRTADKP